MCQEGINLTLRILKHKSEISKARKRLRDLGINCADGVIRILLKKLHLLSGPVLGDFMKSWDVHETAGFLIENLNKNEPILDLGAYASEILPALHQAGFSDLTGIDLNPEVAGMPHHHQIRYLVGDFYGSVFTDRSFSAITAISVIEHGYEPERLFPEISRLLRPGGYFIASVDYWPEKIDTGGIRVFDLDWLVFSRSELQDLFDIACSYGLVPLGDLDFEAENSLIAWQGKQYTFAWMVLMKADNP